jgi:hypothetical protein
MWFSLYGNPAAGKFYATEEMNPFGAGQVCPRDVRRCPDGSYVSRTGPNCSFPPCPPPKYVAPGGVCGGINWQNFQCSPGLQCLDVNGRPASSGTCQKPRPVCKPPKLKAYGLTATRKSGKWVYPNCRVGYVKKFAFRPDPNAYRCQDPQEEAYNRCMGIMI